MRKVDYDKKETENTETLIAVDDTTEHKFGNLQRAYNEGFASADGVRGGTAATNGRVLHPEKGDGLKPNSPPNPVDDENPGLADN
jgi:hypothetical protein